VPDRADVTIKQSAALLDLSQQQKAAVQYIKGPLLVLGGAGSGKTSLLIHKIAWLIRECETPPARVCAIAPSAHAACHIRTGVAQILGRQLPELRVATFAEIGLELIENRLGTLGLLPGYSLYDRSESEAVVARLLRETRADLLSSAAQVANQIMRWKRELAMPSRGTDAPGSSVATIAAWCYSQYEQRLRMANAIDIDDVALKAVNLLVTDSALREEWCARIRFLLVDEYERATNAEHALIKLWSAGPVLTAVGDDDPSQLGTGKPREPFSRLRADYGDLRAIRLDINFRSTPRIARAAAAVGARPAATESPSERLPEANERLRVLQTRSEQQEADGLVASLLAHKARRQSEYRDYAILVPRLDDATRIERALQAQRIPYYVRGAASFFDQPEVRDLRAYLKILCNPADDVSFLRAVNTPRRDIDRIALENLMSYAGRRARPLLECALDPDLAQTLTRGRFAVLHGVATLLSAYAERAAQANPIGLIYDLVAELRYDEWLRDTCNDVKIAERRMQAVTELIEWLRRAARQQPRATLRTLIERLNRASLLGSELHDTSAEGVALMPVAAAKGLEFAHVYIAGFDETWLADLPEPDRQDADTRRLAYIALSSARESVVFTLAEQRRVGGDFVVRRPNRLLADLSGDDIEWTNAASASTNPPAVLAAQRPNGDYPRRFV
jgi:ATP-dependent DNA helicase Rep